MGGGERPRKRWRRSPRGLSRVVPCEAPEPCVAGLSELHVGGRTAGSLGGRSVIYKFGDFELDEERFELRRAGSAVAVQPKVLRMLLLLVRERHRSVSEAELMSALWPDETVSVASIKRAVMGARAAVDDRSQDCIRTVRKHGYQFVLPAVECDAPRSPPPDRRASVPPQRDEPTQGERADFVGRPALLGELDASLARSLAGAGHGVLVFGEPGMGKTRLLRELASRATAGGARAWLGHCMEFDGAPPYWPVQQILREALRDRSDTELRALLGPSASDIAQGVPEIQAWLGDLPASPTVGAARFRFFESTARFLIRAAEEQPLVLLFDDLQCADLATLRFLHFLVRRLGASRCLLVGTARPHDARDQESQAFLAELVRSGAMRSLELAGLSQGEIARYLELRTGAPASEQLVSSLHDQTAGNPLFLEELLRSLHAQGAAQSDGGVPNLAPHAGTGIGLRGAIERHLSTLSPTCRAILERASVLGRDFSLALLKELSDASTTALLACLGEAAESGVLKRPADSVGVYRFTHALIRDVLYQSTPLVERAQRHARVGLALEQRDTHAGDGLGLELLAEHFRLAVPVIDPAKALHYLERAAQRARERLAFEEAALHLQRALDLLDLGEPAPERRMQLLLAQGEAHALATEPAAGRAPLLQAVALARGLQRTDVIAQAACVLGRSRESGAVDAVLVALLREALAALPPADVRVPCLQAMLAKALSFTSERTTRIELAVSALSLSLKLPEPGLRAEALQACHEALPDPDHVARREEIALELERLSHRHPDARTRLSALSSRFQNALERGDVATLEEVVDGLHALANQVRDPSVRWYELSYRATCAMIAGRFTLSEQLAREAFELRRQVFEQIAYHWLCAQLTGVLRLTGRHAEAEGCVRDMCSQFPAISGWRAVRATMQAEAGQRESARETLHQLMQDDLLAVRRDPYLLSALCPVAQLCVRVGDAATARALYTWLLPYAELHGNVSFGAATYGPISLTLGQLAIRMLDLDAAERHCQLALVQADRMRSPTFTSLALLTHAHALRFRELPEAKARSRALLGRAEALSRATGMVTVSAACRALELSLLA